MKNGEYWTLNYNGWHENLAGYKRHYVNGKHHKDDGPALITPDGSFVWYQNGNVSRADGPAIIRSDGTKKWYNENCLVPIFIKDGMIWIGHESKRTIADWDDWFAGNDDWIAWPEGMERCWYSRDSDEFKALVALWEQFKAQQ